MSESTSSQLESKILEDLRKTGYPTEIVVASVMQQRDWAILHNPSYLDDIEGRSREFDLRAYRHVASQAPSRLAIGVFLLTECKKSEKPWVFFTTPETNMHGAQRGRLVKTNGGPRHAFWSDQRDHPALISEDDLFAFHHYFRQPRRARTYHEPLKGRETADHAQMIYTAVQSAVKATLFLSKQQPVESWLRIYYPLIIFNGDMFEARVKSATDIELLRVDYVQLSHHYIEPRGSRAVGAEQSEHAFVVDVVRMEYLEQFLESIEEEQRVIAELLGRLPHPRR